MSELRKTDGVDDIVVDPRQLRRALGEIKSTQPKSNKAKEPLPGCALVADMLEKIHKIGKGLAENGQRLLEPLREAIYWATGQTVRKFIQMIHLLPGIVKDIRRAHRLDEKKRSKLKMFIAKLIERLPEDGIRLRLA